MRAFRLFGIAALSGVSAFVASARRRRRAIERLIIGIHGFLLSSTAIAAPLTGALATAIGYGVAGAAVVGTALLGRQRPQGIRPSDAKSTFETGESSVIEGVGRIRVSGLNGVR